MNGPQRGFTIVELIVVIVIIGILSAVALPRFLNVAGQARTAAVQGFAGSVNSGASMVQARWIVGGGSGTTAAMADGVSITVSSGTGLPLATSAGIGTAVRCNDTNCNGFTATYSGGIAVFKSDSASNPDNCSVTYNGSNGEVSTLVTGCAN